MLARHEVFVGPGWIAARALGVVVLLLAGAVGEPRLGRGQERKDSPYRVVRPRGDGPHPALLFVSGCSGFAPHEAPRHYLRTAENFAARGYVVVFVDYLGARGQEVCGGAIRPHMVAGDILAAVEYARSASFIQPSDISVIGWSMGGGGVLAAIASLPVDAPPPFRAAIAYYPECYGVTMPLRVRVPLLMLLAGLDDVSWTWACQDLVKRLPRDFPVEVRLYPQARHAFDVPELPPALSWRGGGTLGHDPNAAAAAREEVKRFLGR
jgi:dienelactone hydrolase